MMHPSHAMHLSLVGSINVVASLKGDLRESYKTKVNQWIGSGFMVCRPIDQTDWRIENGVDVPAMVELEIIDPTGHKYRYDVWTLEKPSWRGSLCRYVIRDHQAGPDDFDVYVTDYAPQEQPCLFGPWIFFSPMWQGTAPAIIHVGHSACTVE